METIRNTCLQFIFLELLLKFARHIFNIGKDCECIRPYLSIYLFIYLFICFD